MLLLASNSTPTGQNITNLRLSIGNFGPFQDGRSRLNLGRCHYLAGRGKGHYFGGEGHNFFPSCLGEGHNFFKVFLGEGHNFFKVFLLRK